ncbi:MAG: glycerol-3-phosphate acyltransferase [bacterium]|nr:glycerol-3-phosphate acyltransferase [bacterium]
MTTLLFTLFGFFLGSLPFSVWVGRYGLRKDVRDYGDGNPGAFNVIRAGGLAWGGLAMVLDITKGALPVGLAHYVVGIEGIALVPIALAPVLGHAFSPFLNFKGGKAIATTGGIWIGLTLWTVPLVGMIALVLWYLVLTSSGWAVMFTMGTILAFLLAARAGSVLLAVWALNLLLFIYKHRTELVHPPVFRIPPPLRGLLGVRE